jgi:uncharacterized protein YndB with AHSA1/START domain
MPVNRDEAGNRWVQAEVEVPGTPEQVWQAIATGPGISSWFVPAQVEEREGGQTVCNFGPGMDSVAKIVEWNPPHKFVAESNDLGPDKPAIATEWIVEAKEGGKCVVRVVHRWFTDKDDWDQQFEGHTYGWIEFFRVLRLYLAHFSGQPCTALQFTAFAPEPKEEAWAKLMEGLGLPCNFEEGQRVQTNGEAPKVSGVVERAGKAPYAEDLLLRIDQPAPGLARFFAMPMGGTVLLSVRFFFYGEAAATAASAADGEWTVWLNRTFPQAGE